MKITAVMALAMVVAIGCQMEEGNETAEVKVGRENEVLREDCVDYDFEQHVFYPDDEEGLYRVPINFRIPATICQDRPYMAVEICLENGGKKDMETLRYEEDQGGDPGFTEPGVGLGADGKPQAPLTTQEYVSDADGRIYSFDCNKKGELVDIRMSNADRGTTRGFEGERPDDMGKNEDKHPGDIQNECWPKSPEACRSPTP